jgi:3-oxoacyl-[acyl-carrier protein] reductase
METGLQDKVVLITGAGRNIGRATALHFAKEGCRLVLSTRQSQELLDETAAACGELGAEATTTLCDVTDVDQVGAMVQQANERFGGVDVVVNNATFRSHSKFLNTTYEEWRAAMAANLDGPFHVCQAVIPGMVERGWGRIVNYSGISAYHGGGPTKSAAKLGIVGFTRGLAREFGKHDITVNCIAPGSIAVERDPGLERAADIAGKVDDDVPIQRFGAPDEIASLVVYLSSKQAGYITGQTYHVNGGAFFQ